MGKQVPLVIYQGGIRTVIGMASVGDDGSIEAQVTRDQWPTVKKYFMPTVGEFSISPARKPVIVHDPPEEDVFLIQGPPTLHPKI